MKIREKNEILSMSLNTQYGVILEETASSLTQGGTGSGSESRFAWRWPY